VELRSEFRGALTGIDLDVLDSDPATIVGVEPNLRIAFVNDAWFRFAAANGARWQPGEWGLGANLVDATPSDLRPFYDLLFAVALRTGEAVAHDYECSSAERYRKFRMRIHPLEGKGYLVTHTPTIERAHDLESHAPTDLEYLHASGLYLQCAHCRRTRHALVQNRWDWVPSYVSNPPSNVSHGLCPVCFAYHYRD